MESTIRSCVLSQLATLCRDQTVEEKIVFVPSRQIGHNLGTALARSGVAWVNLRLTSPADWADRLVGGVMRAEGLRPLVQDEGAFFLLDAIRNESWPVDHPFARGVSAAGFAKTLHKTIRSLRAAGIRPDELPTPTREIDRILRRQYAAYCEWKHEHGLYDRADLFIRAAAEGPDPSAVYAILDETPLPECAHQFVRSISGGDLLRIGIGDGGIPSPEHSARFRFSSAPAISGGVPVGRGGRVLTEGLLEEDREIVAVRGAVGVESEIRGALRELFARGATLDTIEIAYTSESPYLPLLVEETERLNLPATFAAGVPVTCTRPGQALLGFLRWMANGFDPKELVRLFRGRLIFLHRKADPRTAAAAGGMVLEARIGPGRFSWQEALDRLIQEVDGRHSSAGSEGGQQYFAYRRDAALRIREVLEALYDLCPHDEPVTLDDLCTSARAFLDKFAACEGDREARARDSLSDRLTELSEGAPSSGRLSDLASMLLELIQDHKVEAAVARPGCVYVVPLERAGYSGRSETVIAGLAETTFPGPALEDPVLLDAARARFGGRMELQRTRASDPAFHLIRTLGMASGRITMVANTRDIADGREIYPAALFEQTKEQLGVETLPIYAPIPDIVDALTETEVALALRHVDGTASSLFEQYPWLIHGRRAMEARADDRLSEFDGWLNGAALDLRPGTETALSASRLEDLAACPYRYFLKNILHVRPPDIPEDMPGRWLTPMEFGALLHDILKAFMERLAAQGESVDADRHSQLMDEVVNAEIERYRKRIPVHLEAGYRADRQRLQRAVRVFLAEESRRNAHPVGFEVSFGMGQSGEFDVAEPVEVHLAEGLALSLRGAIDRVDRTNGGYEVWDYKTGSTYDFGEDDLLSGGRRLQWALYAYVFDELLRRKGLDGSVERSGYFFTNDREHGLRLSESPPEPEELGRRLAPLFDLVGKGAFLHVQKSNACRYCDYAEVCASERRDKKQMDAMAGAAGPEHDFLDDLKAWLECET